MTVKIEKINILSKGFNDLIDITNNVQNIVSRFNTQNGILNVFCSSSTASIVTLENEPGIGFDLAKLLDEFVPINKIYQHDNLWHEGNAFAHLKATMLGNNITLPIIEGKVELSTCQQIVLIDFDNKPSSRQIIVSVVE